MDMGLGVFKGSSTYFSDATLDTKTVICFLRTVVFYIIRFNGWSESQKVGSLIHANFVEYKCRNGQDCFRPLTFLNLGK